MQRIGYSDDGESAKPKNRAERQPEISKGGNSHIPTLTGKGEEAVVPPDRIWNSYRSVQ